eukprot:COSAG02_NODE_38549_length_427_cov_27.198171_2_plen_49_part_01
MNEQSTENNFASSDNNIRPHKQWQLVIRRINRNVPTTSRKTRKALIITV